MARTELLTVLLVFSLGSLSQRFLVTPINFKTLA